MNSNKPAARELQQQPARESDPQQQQQSGSSEFQPTAGAGQSKQEMGEGSYEGTREYNKRTAEYLKNHDVEAEAEAAKPRSEEEARDMERAEEEGKSHSRGEH